MKNKQTIVTRQGSYYTVRVITGVKSQPRRPQPDPSNGTSLSAEEAAKRIAQRFGRSLAVLAD
jgi:hypothetical protein